MDWIRDYLPEAQQVAAFVAAVAAVASFLSVWAIRRQTQASVLLQCLNTYTAVRKDGSAANTDRLCRDYYREILDLLWSEFHIWQSGLLPDVVMKAWLDARQRNWRDDTLSFTDSGGQLRSVTYKECFEALVAENYFAPNDPFVQFMKLTHDSKIQDALKMRRKWKFI